MFLSGRCCSYGRSSRSSWAERVPSSGMTRNGSSARAGCLGDELSAVVPASDLVAARWMVSSLPRLWAVTVAAVPRSPVHGRARRQEPTATNEHPIPLPAGARPAGGLRQRFRPLFSKPGRVWRRRELPGRGRRSGRSRPPRHVGRVVARAIKARRCRSSPGAGPTARNHRPSSPSRSPRRRSASALPARSGAWWRSFLLRPGQLPPITGATIVTGEGASAELTSTRTPAAIAFRTCAALVNGRTARSTLPGAASTSRTSVQAPV